MDEKLSSRIEKAKVENKVSNKNDASIFVEIHTIKNTLV